MPPIFGHIGDSLLLGLPHCLISYFQCEISMQEAWRAKLSQALSKTTRWTESWPANVANLLSDSWQVLQKLTGRNDTAQQKVTAPTKNGSWLQTLKSELCLASRDPSSLRTTLACRCAKLYTPPLLSAVQKVRCPPIPGNFH